MPVWTEGRIHHPGYRLGMSFQSGTYPQLFTDLPDNGDEFCLILAQEGAGTWQAGEYVYPLLAPAMHCLNLKESARFMAEAAQDGVKRLWFHPGALNERLDGMLSVKERGTRNPVQGIASTGYSGHVAAGIHPKPASPRGSGSSEADFELLVRQL